MNDFYTLSSDIGFRYEEFGGLIFDRGSWSIYEVNRAGYLILRLLANHSISKDNILQYLVSIYGQIDTTQVATIDDYLRRLFKMKIIQRTDAGDQFCGDINSRLLSFHNEQLSTNHNKRVARYFQAPIFVWWDITALCNLKCRHCYSSSGRALPDELNTKEVCRILDDLATMQVFYVYFLGGEPFLRKDFLQILEHCRSIGIEVMINTNGWFINDALAHRLVELGVRQVRVSIDASCAKAHDAIRGVSGSYERALRSIKLLKSAGLSKVGISPTMMSVNADDAESLVDLAASLEVDEIQLGQICPVGRGNNEKLALDTSAILNLREVIKRKSAELKGRLFISGAEGVWKNPHSDCVMQGNMFPTIMGCGAGRSCLAISPSGKLRACLLFQYEVGNLRQHRFKQIWMNSENEDMNMLRAIKDGCEGCAYEMICSGPCPMQHIISNEQRRCFVSKTKENKHYAHKHSCYTGKCG